MRSRLPWLRAGRAAVVVAVGTLLSSLTGVPAFLTPGLPAAAVISAAVGVVLAVVTAVLLLVPAPRVTGSRGGARPQPPRPAR